MSFQVLLSLYIRWWTLRKTSLSVVEGKPPNQNRQFPEEQLLYPAVYWSCDTARKLLLFLDEYHLSPSLSPANDPVFLLEHDGSPQAKVRRSCNLIQ